MFHIEHDNETYRPIGLIPVNLGTLHEGFSTFQLKFFCKNSCHQMTRVKLGVSFFTQNKPTDENDQVYGVNHGACDTLYPLEIK